MSASAPRRRDPFLRAAWMLTILLIVAGVAIEVVSDSGLATAIGAGLLGAATVVILCITFYLVGRSEDEERSRGRS